MFGERAPTQGQYAPVVGIFLKQKHNNEPLTIVGDGSQKRDFIHVKDVASANLHCLELCKSSTGVEIYNIGSGENISIKELATNISSNTISIPERKGEAIDNLCSNVKFCNVTNWRPKIKIIDWINSQNE